MEWTAPLHCDTVEWCPYNKDLLIVGCYELDEEGIAGQPGQRRGALVSLRVGNSLEVVDILSLNAGVLDCRWTQKSESPFLVTAVAAKTGIVIYRLVGEKLEESCRWEGSDGIALSCEWSKASENHVICSDSNGAVHFLQHSNYCLSSVISYPAAHSHEAWTAASHSSDSNIYFSGGDDCKLQVYDIRSQNPAISNRKSHLMGVTSIEHHGLHNLSTGSYDEKVRLWDMRSLRNEVSIKDVGGGVWRIKRKDQWIGIARMYGGFCILPASALCLEKSDCCGEPKNLEEDIVSIPFTSEKCLGYGFSWCSDGRIAVCSFYDNRVFVTDLEKILSK